MLPFGAPVRIDQGTSSPDNVHRAPSHLTLSQLSGLVRALAAEPSVPTTLAIDPRTAQVLPASGVVGRQTLAALGTLAEAGSTTEVPSASYVPVDLGALAAAGLTGEITYQMEIGSATMARAGIRTDPAAATWITSGDVDQNLAAGLSDAGVSRVVVPDASLPAIPVASASRKRSTCRSAGERRHWRPRPTAG